MMAPRVIGVKEMPGMYAIIGKVPGGYAVRPLVGGKPFVIHKNRVVDRVHEDFLARYSGTDHHVKVKAVAHTSYKRAVESILDRAETKAQAIRKR